MSAYWRDFSELDRCDFCPIYRAGFCPGNDFSFVGGAPFEPPCCEFDDDMDMDAVVQEMRQRRARSQAAKAQLDAKEAARKERARKAAQTKAEVRDYCSVELAQVKRLRILLGKIQKEYDQQYMRASAIQNAHRMMGESYVAAFPDYRIVEECRCKLIAAESRYEAKRAEFYEKRKRRGFHG